jgi:LacI family transcriptional regulator
MAANPQTGRVTLQTVAEAAGVHRSTASRALNPLETKRVGDQTVSRVRMVAEQLGYEPHPWARSLRTNRTLTIGLLIPRLTDVVLAGMFEAAADRAREHGYQAVTVSTGEQEGVSRQLVEGLLDRRVDGLILATATLEDPLADELKEQGVPFVLMNRSSRDHLVVRGDDALGGYLATKHLLAQGHDRIGFIAGALQTSTSHSRLEGYRRAHDGAGLAVDPALIVPSSFGIDGGIAAAGQLLSLDDPPTAIFAVNDATAIGAIATIRDLGLTVPTDLAMVGYNNTDVGQALNVPLSSVAIPLQQMGRLAVDMLMARLAGDEPESIVLPPRLIVRASSSWERARTKHGPERQRASPVAG